MRVDFFGVDDQRMTEALAIRFKVFVDEQHVPGEIEIDEYDRKGSKAVHALVYVEDKPVSAGRFYEKDSRTVQIGRMAVLKDVRGLGFGRSLLDALAEEAKRRGYTEARLHAQTHARGFYEKAGFIPHGNEFDDAGIPHIEMKRRL
jgi:predicted GNAT family N-acyltransferase